MAFLRAWLFRVLVLAAAAIMLLSAVMVWWTSSTEILAHAHSGIDAFTVSLYQHGIPDNFAREYFRADITPSYQVTLAWVYMGVSIALILLSMFLKGRKGRWLLGITGTVYIIYAVVALFLIIDRTGFYSVPLQGEVFTEGESITQTGFHPGYYLAYASGLLCLILALLRDKILVKNEPKE